MDKIITIALHLESKDISESLTTLAGNLPAASIIGWNPQSPTALPPDIVIIEDLGCESVITQIEQLHSVVPGLTIFIVSGNRDPRHIIRVMKHGGAEYLLTPVDGEQFVRAVDEVRSRSAISGDRKRGEVYSFISAKGGLGSTVLAVNTASAMAQDKQERIALWDMSFQSGDSLVLLDLMPQRTVTDICHNIQRLDFGLLKSAMTTHQSGVDLLAAPQNPEEAEDVSASHVAKILDLTSSIYDRLFIDCTSMSITHNTVEAFNFSTKVFIVADLSIPAVRNAARIGKLIRQMGISIAKVEFVVNRFMEGSSLPLAKVEKTLGKPVYWLFPNDFNQVIASINTGIPLVTAGKKSELAKSIFSFVEKIKDPDAMQNLKSSPRWQFWRKK